MRVSRLSVRTFTQLIYGKLPEHLVKEKETTNNLANYRPVERVEVNAIELSKHIRQNTSAAVRSGYFAQSRRRCGNVCWLSLPVVRIDRYIYELGAINHTAPFFFLPVLHLKRRNQGSHIPYRSKSTCAKIKYLRQNKIFK